MLGHGGKPALWLDQRQLWVRRDPEEVLTALRFPESHPKRICTTTTVVREFPRARFGRRHFLRGPYYLRVSDVTRILDRVQQGEAKAAEDLLPLVYDELRKLAAHKMAQEAPGQTLQPTALVHEAYLRLVGSSAEQWNGRGHFFAAAAEAMRRILIENARRKQRLKHGGDLQRVGLTALDLAQHTTDEELLAVDEALDRFAMLDPVGAELVKLRFFIGLPNVEAARLLGIPERTAKRTWAYARAWLHEELKRSL